MKTQNEIELHHLEIVMVNMATMVGEISRSGGIISEATHKVLYETAQRILDLRKAVEAELATPVL